MLKRDWKSIAIVLLILAVFGLLRFMYTANAEKKELQSRLDKSFINALSETRLNIFDDLSEMNEKDRFWTSFRILSNLHAAEKLAWYSSYNNNNTQLAYAVYRTYFWVQDWFTLGGENLPGRDVRLELYNILLDIVLVPDNEYNIVVLNKFLEGQGQ